MNEFEFENIDNLTGDELNEGCLYVYKKGVLQEIETDPDDLMKRVKITPDAFSEVSKLQNKMRKHMSGYRPDISSVCSALLKHAANSDEAVSVVSDFVVSLYHTLSTDN